MVGNKVLRIKSGMIAFFSFRMFGLQNNGLLNFVVGYGNNLFFICHNRIIFELIIRGISCISNFGDDSIIRN